MVAEKVESAMWFGAGAVACVLASLLVPELTRMTFTWVVVAALGACALGFAASAARLAGQKIDAVHAALTQQPDATTTEA